MTVISVLRWISFFTLIGLFVGIWVMTWVGFAILRKLDRDHGDRNLLRAYLMRESDAARRAIEAVDPNPTEDRRKPL